MWSTNTLPMIPTEIVLAGHSPKSRAPGYDEIAAYEWIGEWITAKQRLCAIAAFRRDYDTHSNRDVLEMVQLSGSKRGCYTLLRYMRDLADLEGRGRSGTIHTSNKHMLRALARVGMSITGLRMGD